MKYLMIFLMLLLLVMGLFAQDNIQILMDSDKMVTAHFKKIQCTLITVVDPIGSGTISEAGIYDIGTIVEVVANPAQDYVFSHWSFGKWSGLGIMVFVTLDPVDNEEYVDTVLANGFTEIRKGADWDTWSTDTLRLPQILYAVGKGADVIWGVQSGGTILTASNWGDYEAAVLAAAQWAQDNGIFEFSIGNEEEAHNDDTTLTDTQLRTNLKILATEVKAIFTNGNISYTCDQSNHDSWISIGKGDLDILAVNIYMGGNGTYDDNWKGDITDLVNAFGVDGTYLTEFAPSYTSLDDYSADEAVQATAVTEMIEYIKASGMTRAIWFCYNDAPWLSGFGVLKADGTYRQLWNSLINSE